MQGQQMENRTQTINIIDVMAHIVDKPLMVTDAMARLLMDHIRAGTAFQIPVYDVDETVNDEDIAIINVFGGMSHRGGWWRTSYESIRANFRTALNDSSVKAILFNFDTPGGVVSGVFDLADEIRNSRDVKPSYAFVNEQATSAGYALASATSKVFSPRTGMVGSIGVRMIHVDFSKMDKAAGIKVSIIYAGARKIDFDDSMPLSPEARKVGQDCVDKAYDLFVKTVYKNRRVGSLDLTEEKIRATEAGIFEGEDAKTAGLIDDVMTFEQAINYIKNN